MKYSTLCEVYERLFSTTKRLEKTYHAAKFLKKADKDLDKIILLLQGKVFPSFDDRKMGVAARLVLKALATSTGISQERIEEEWKKKGDLGLVAEELIKKKSQVTLFSTDITVSKVFNNLQKIATFEGEGTVDKKVQLIAELLTSATPVEAKYIVRTLLEEMRVGLGEGTLRDAIAWAYFAKPMGVFFQCGKCKAINPQNKTCLECGSEIDLKDHGAEDVKTYSFDTGLIEREKDELHRCDALITDDPREAYSYIIGKVQSAFDVSNDFSVVAEAARKEGILGLEKIKMEVGRPVKVMLAIKEASIPAAFERTGRPAAIEYKYDGFRMLIHKKGDDITIYTRRLENVTAQFPEVVALIGKHIDSGTAVLDSEAVGYDPKTRKYLPFQSISQRIKRKYGIKEMAERFPVELNLFDVIYLDGKELLNERYEDRREMLKNALKNPIERRIVLARQLITDDEKEAERFYQESLKEGNEGVMFKTISAPYKPGARVGFMIKLKSAMDALDLAIVGAEWGEGKRSGWLSSFVIACRDPDTDELLEIGRVGTGIKEKESDDLESGVTFEQLTNLLRPLIISEKGKEVKVKPDIIISVLYEEIQKSPTYASGYALRFPRLVALREDRGIDDIATIDEIEETYHSQKGK